jgi:hypothetical protein
METSGKFILMTSDEFREWLMKKESNRTIRCIQNYYTVMPAYASFNGKNHFQLLTGMEEYQIFENGYDEIAQNITTFPDGKIALCRDFNKIPAGKNGASAFCIRIEHIGNPDAENGQLTEAQLDCNIWLNAMLCMKFRIKPATTSIVSHPRVDLVSKAASQRLASALSYPGTTDIFVHNIARTNN